MDAFDRRKAQRDIEILKERAKRMSVPAPLSAKCETREHSGCTGQAISVLTDKQTRCTCSCHRTTRDAR